WRLPAQLHAPADDRCRAHLGREQERRPLHPPAEAGGDEAAADQGPGRRLAREPAARYAEAVSPWIPHPHVKRRGLRLTPLFLRGRAVAPVRALHGQPAVNAPPPW